MCIDKKENWEIIKAITMMLDLVATFYKIASRKNSQCKFNAFVTNNYFYRKEPFQQMIDRSGKNVNSQLSLNAKGNINDTRSSYNPGPGQYDVNSGFD